MAMVGAESRFRTLARSMGDAGNRKRWGEPVAAENRAAYRAAYKRLRRKGVAPSRARELARAEVGLAAVSHQPPVVHPVFAAQIAKGDDVSRRAAARRRWEVLRADPVALAALREAAVLREARKRVLRQRAAGTVSAQVAE